MYILTMAKTLKCTFYLKYRTDAAIEKSISVAFMTQSFVNDVF